MGYQGVPHDEREANRSGEVDVQTEAKTCITVSCR